jgi:hypothetical protein
LPRGFLVCDAFGLEVISFPEDWLADETENSGKLLMDSHFFSLLESTLIVRKPNSALNLRPAVLSLLWARTLRVGVKADFGVVERRQMETD